MGTTILPLSIRDASEALAALGLPRDDEDGWTSDRAAQMLDTAAREARGGLGLADLYSVVIDRVYRRAATVRVAACLGVPVDRLDSGAVPSTPARRPNRREMRAVSLATLVRQLARATGPLPGDLAILGPERTARAVWRAVRVVASRVVLTGRPEHVPGIPAISRSDYRLLRAPARGPLRSLLQEEIFASLSSGARAILNGEWRRPEAGPKSHARRAYDAAKRELREAREDVASLARVAG